MDKILKFFTYSLIIAIALNSVSLQAQETEDNKSIVGSDIYYWFYIKIGKSSNRLSVKHVGNEVMSGTLNDFIIDHQQGLMAGKIFLGPFYQEYQVKQSQLFYKYAGKNGEIPGLNVEVEGKETEFSFFYIKPFSENYLSDIYLERIPSRVGSGTQNDFRNLLDIGLDYEKLAVGPFFKHELAEKSKFAFGSSVGESAKNETDSLNNKRLMRMAKKWESLKLVIARQRNSEDSTEFAFRFSTKFPRRYFAPTAIQTITVSANYDDFNNATRSFTLQGDEVIDNNYAVSYQMSRVYIKRFYFDKYDGANIRGFLFESFIYNDLKMIELAPVYIKVK